MPLSRKRALIIFTVIAVVLLALDRITKGIAIDILTDSGPIAFLPAFLDFALVYNIGGAFGLFEGGAIIFVGVAVIAFIVIVAYIFRAKDLYLPVVIALAMISAGAIGNAIDRAFYGAVPDFIHTLFIDFPVFNVADICLTVGEILLIVSLAWYWFGPKSRQLEEGEEGEDTAEPAELLTQVEPSDEEEAQGTRIKRDEAI